MVRLIAMMSIVALLVGFGIFEEIYVRDIITNLTAHAAELETLIKDSEEDLTKPEIAEKLDEIDAFWHGRVRFLTYIVNFEKVRPVTESISKLKTALAEEDYSLSIENATLLRFYAEHLTYVMGAEISNIL